MTSPPSKDRSPASDPPAIVSAVRPTGRRAPTALRELERPDPTIEDLEPVGAAEIPIDSSELERVSLIEQPALARYGRYELLGRLAYGGMAEIFLAREAHVSAHRMLVIKRVLPHVAEDRHFVDMFVDEARLAMQLNHPNICHVYSFGEEEGTYYIAMEWVNGKTLSKIIRKARQEGGLPIPVALKVVAQVAEALDYAHRACDANGEPLGIVHRDVSPQNIMVSYDGAVKLLDFGIAKAASHSTRTEAGVIKGKFAYMSPQQCVGEPIDGRADIFALGVCLFEALTGRNPFRRKTEFETMSLIVREPTPDVRERRPEVPEEVQAILEKALMKQPEERYQSAGEMQLALEAAIAKLGVVVNGARIGEVVSRLFIDEVREGPELDRRMSLVPRADGIEESRETLPPRPRPDGATELDAEAIPASLAEGSPKERRTLALVLVPLLLVGLAGAGGILAWATLASPAPIADAPIARTEAPTASSAPELSSDASDPAPVVAPQSTGSVFIESVPPGATISLGDHPNVGVTPLEIGMIAPGTYEVRLALDGHQEWRGEVVVAEGQRESVRAELERVPRRTKAAARPPGQLSLNTRPWSKVYLGNRLLGTTPLGRVTVPSGTQRLRLVDRDGNEHRKTVRVPPGGHVVESFDLR